jgi:hypothetical protein
MSIRTCWTLRPGKKCIPTSNSCIVMKLSFPGWKSEKMLCSSSSLRVAPPYFVAYNCRAHVCVCVCVCSVREAIKGGKQEAVASCSQHSIHKRLHIVKYPLNLPHSFSSSSWGKNAPQLYHKSLSTQSKQAFRSLRSMLTWI